MEETIVKKAKEQRVAKKVKTPKEKKGKVFLEQNQMLDLINTINNKNDVIIEKKVNRLKQNQKLDWERTKQKKLQTKQKKLSLDLKKKTILEEKIQRKEEKKLVKATDTPTEKRKSVRFAE
ncbi:hypothetical protein HDV02_005437 [Globomyces sp. JEL0801]|nr:hypothetical protein HDV02_005437 [Globomyces sp. JEL0801]